jgi:hypothetical protein
LLFGLRFLLGLCVAGGGASRQHGCGDGDDDVFLQVVNALNCL